MSKRIYKVVEDFEEEICKYTGAPFAVALDNASNALFLALTYVGIKDQLITIPSRTYPSVPCEIIHAGGHVSFEDTPKKTITGAYQLKPTQVWDSALRFTADMYIPGTYMCVSFTGPYKHLKLTKGGAILTDNCDASKWFKRARYSGRRECSYHEDFFDMIGWNFYMMPEIAIRGVQQIQQFYKRDGSKKRNKDVEMEYPDLSKFEVYTKK